MDAVGNEDYDLNALWEHFRSSKERGVPYSIFDTVTRDSFERWWGVILNQGCSMPEKPPRYVCDFCCKCGEFRHNGIASIDQVQDDDDSDDEYIWIDEAEEVDELRLQILRQNFEIVYDAEKNWIIYKYPLCRMCWERESEFQQA
jgi:hypothetical protein